ncbi:MAG: tetratricopeptide repeat protein [Verrucomicrobiales bacterium]
MEHPICLFALLLAACPTFVTSVSAAEADVAAAPAATGAGEKHADLRQLLQQALFEEEATRNLDKAAEAYDALLNAYQGQQQLAATALFRLAEVRRKQGRNIDAIALYQKLVAEFPNAEPQAKMSRENLSALGARIRPQSDV